MKTTIPQSQSQSQHKYSILSQQQPKPSEKPLQQQLQQTQSPYDGLNQTKIFGYGVGHFFNDLAAACWFNYLLFFLKRVVKTQAASSALFAGQIADGIATPIVGILSDRTKNKHGQRTPWYVGGFVVVFACYIPLYHIFVFQNIASQYAYYIIVAILINVGWAAVQISHMSLVPSLTCSRKRRDKLNNLRNAFTFIANFGVLLLGVVIFKVMNDPPLQYAMISYIVSVVGFGATAFFLYQIRQVKLTEICKQKANKLKYMINQSNKVTSTQNIEQNNSSGQQTIQKNTQLQPQNKQSIFDWFKMPKFYLFGICYMGVRLYTNMFGTFLPFYLIGVLKLGLQQSSSQQEIVPFTVALVPLIVYLFSVLASLRLNWFYDKFGRKTALSVGTGICVVCLGSMLFLTENSSWVMYIIAIFVGVSQTMVLSTGINFISDVVGTKAKTGAFVFGIYSLLDKFSAGIVIFFISSSSAYSKQNLHDLTEQQKQFIKYTMILIPALASVLATLIVISYPIKQYNKDKGKLTDQKNGVNKVRKNSIQEELVL